MRVDFFFPVPFLVHDIDPSVRDSIHRKVHAYLESAAAKRDIEPAPEESVSTSYYKPEASILVDADLGDLEAIVVEAANRYLEQTLELGPRRVEVERAWINVFPPGAQEGQHTHDGSLLSCSYYVDAPERCGNIAFPDPIGARRSYREFTRTSGDNLLTRKDIAFAPEPGRLILFESWIPHYVQSNKSDEPRISIAMNLREATRPVTPKRATDSKRDAGAAASSPAAGDNQPFLFDDLFAIAPNLTVRTERIGGLVPAIVIDDFLLDPERARRVVGSAPAGNWKRDRNGRNFVDYYDCRLRFPVQFPNAMIAAAQQAIAKVSSFETRPQDPSVDVNWFMQINEKRADFAVPHCDVTENVRRSFTCIVYLNRDDECSGGTAFFRFRKTDSLVFDDAYARAMQQDTRIAETGRDYWPERADEHWEKVGAVDMVPGRLLIFASEYFHAAYHPENSFYAFPRLTLAFWVVT